jgi:hypothetical protein
MGDFVLEMFRLYKRNQYGYKTKQVSSSSNALEIQEVPSLNLDVHIDFSNISRGFVQTF